MKLKLHLSLPITLLFSFNLFAQAPIDIAETTLKVAMLDTQEFYYGLAEGDQLILNFEEMNGKELKEFEITELPASPIFLDYKSKKIDNKIITIRNTGIYKFRLYNSSLGGRVCKMKIQRIPASETSKKFNTAVYWKTIRDTVYTPVEERYLESTEKVAKEIYSSCPQISSQTAINGNKNYQIVNFDLPEHTTAWSFYIGTGNEGKAEYQKAENDFLKQGATVLATAMGYGALATLAANGASYFSKVQGADNVKYWFLSDANSVGLFQSGQQFYTYKKGDVVTEASQMVSPLSGRIYLALMNDNTIDVINLTVKVIAIQSIEHWNVRTNKVMSFNERQEAYLKS